MDVAILLFPGFTALDAIGPYEVLARLPGAQIRWVAQTVGPVKTEDGFAEVVAHETFADTPRADVLVVPGGFGTRGLVKAAAVGAEPHVEWIRAVHEHTRFTASVCTGALLLGAAGILAGIPATTHWLAVDFLPKFGATAVPKRVVESGKIFTSAGVSAGIDMALLLAARIAGEETAQAIQLSIEYDPEPPFDAGSPTKAPPGIVEALRKRARKASEL